MQGDLNAKPGPGPGVQGVTGATGVSGASGVSGQQGLTGVRGITGVTGVTGTSGGGGAVLPAMGTGDPNVSADAPASPADRTVYVDMGNLSIYVYIEAATFWYGPLVG